MIASEPCRETCPCSTTPGMACRASESAIVSGMRPNDASRIIMSAVGNERLGSPSCAASSAPDRPSRASRVRCALGRAQAEPVDLDRQRKAAEMSTSFDLSAMTIIRAEAAATIFSRSSAPPPPLIRLSAGSISSAPSTVEVQFRLLVQRRQRHAELAAEARRAFRRRHAGDGKARRRPSRRAAGRTPRRSSRCRCPAVMPSSTQRKGAAAPIPSVRPGVHSCCAVPMMAAPVISRPPARQPAIRPACNRAAL